MVSVYVLFANLKKRKGLRLTGIDMEDESTLLAQKLVATVAREYSTYKSDTG